MTRSMPRTLSELLEFRHVLTNLIARDLKVRYQDKALGFLWSLLHPAALLAIWYLVFKHVARIDIGGPRYWAFLIPGMLTYQFIQGAIVEGARAVRDNSGIVRKVYVPIEILVIATVTVKLIEYAVQLALAAMLLMLLHRGDGGVWDGAQLSVYKTLAVVPGAVLLMFLFALGVAMPLAGYTVLYRDLDHLLGLLLTALLYLSPIFWSLSMIETKPWAWCFALNPVADLIVLLRDPMYWGTWPKNPAVGGGSGMAWLAATTVAFGTFAVGSWLLGRVKHTLSEVV